MSRSRATGCRLGRPVLYLLLNVLFVRFRFGGRRPLFFANDAEASKLRSGAPRHLEHTRQSFRTTLCGTWKNTPQSHSRSKTDSPFSLCLCALVVHSLSLAVPPYHTRAIRSDLLATPRVAGHPHGSVRTCPRGPWIFPWFFLTDRVSTLGLKGLCPLSTDCVSGHSDVFCKSFDAIARLFIYTTLNRLPAEKTAPEVRI